MLLMLFVLCCLGFGQDATIKGQASIESFESPPPWPITASEQSYERSFSQPILPNEMGETFEKWLSLHSITNLDEYKHKPKTFKQWLNGGKGKGQVAAYYEYKREYKALAARNKKLKFIRDIRVGDCETIESGRIYGWRFDAGLLKDYSIDGKWHNESVNCRGLYEDTVDKKTSDLTVRERDWLEACKARDLYPPKPLSTGR